MRRFVTSLALCLAPAAVLAQRPLLLVPQPREARAVRDLALTRGLEIAIPSDDADAFAARDLRDALREAGVSVATRSGTGSGRIVHLMGYLYNLRHHFHSSS